jgi:succinate dehydrogenase / fumarate reductase flavoprotein subunit
LGASALMQGLADGYFVLPYTIADYLSADIRTGAIPTIQQHLTKLKKELKIKLISS